MVTPAKVDTTNIMNDGQAGSEPLYWSPEQMLKLEFEREDHMDQAPPLPRGWKSGAR